MEKIILNFKDSPYSNEMKELVSKILSQETGRQVVIVSLGHITRNNFMQKTERDILDINGMYNDMKITKSTFFQCSFAGDNNKMENIFVQISSNKAAIYYT